MNKSLEEIIKRSRESELIETEHGKIAKDRSVGVALFVWWVDRKDNKIVFLANKRGTKTTEFKETWNLPSGYLNWNETGEEGAARECLEECGIEIDPGNIKLAETSTRPEDNPRQNVIFRYITFLTNKPEVNFDYIDKSESTEVVFIKENEIDEYKFAWKQKEAIIRLIDKAKLEKRIYNL